MHARLSGAGPELTSRILVGGMRVAPLGGKKVDIICLKRLVAITASYFGPSRWECCMAYWRCFFDGTVELDFPLFALSVLVER